MYFKKLEIFGFKSFAEKTQLNFEPGITAVVGPNGCGKSNVFDAIRWVLGEQSAKQLRGSGMEDVIFNGTDTKLALGFAEVSVTFDNQSKMLAVDANEVMITRRLFRSGESEYLINKEVVRLRDVTELFMGTGVGAEAYSLVQQGRVDLVVSAKPDDRRMIFDEAAGITKYKAKKREAENKLKETDQNLLRINDIVLEVKRQIASIERQAQKARRYKEEFEKLKGLETLLARWQLSLAQKQKLEISQALSQMKGRDGEHAAELEELRGVVERDSLLLEELENKLLEVREADLKLDNQLELANRQIIFNEERLGSIDENKARISSDRASLEEKCRQDQARIGEFEASVSGLAASLAAALEGLNSRKSALSGLAALIDEYQETIRLDEEKVLSMTARQVEIHNQQTENMKGHQGALARRRRLDVEIAKLTLEREETAQKLRGIAQGMTESLGRRQRFMEDLAREKEALASRNNELAELNSRLDDLEKKKLFLISQKDFIEKLQVQYQDIPDPVITGRFLSPLHPSDKQTGVIGKVKAVAALDPQRHESLKQYLNDLPSESLYEVVCETKFIELDPQEMAARIEEIDLKIKVMTEERAARASAIAEQSRLVERVQQDIHAEDRRLSVCEAQHQDAGSLANKLQEEWQAVTLEIQETDEALARYKSAEEALGGELRSVDEQIVSARAQIVSRQAAILDKRREREAAAVAVAQTEGEVSALRDREKGFLSNIEMFRTDLANCQSGIIRLDEEESALADRARKLLAEIDQHLVGVDAIKADKEALKAALARHDLERGDVDQRITSLRAQISGMEREIVDNRETVHEHEMRIQKVAFEEQAIRERLMQKYGIDLSSQAVGENGSAEVRPPAGDAGSGETLPAGLPEGAPEASQEEVPEDFDPEKTVQDIQLLTRRCESFGAVNLVAIEEFEELKGRFQFLTKQQSDLLSAKDSLEQTIRKINKTTRQLFVDTFVRVNEQFRVYFRMLFSGGEAQLILVDPENALESGIEIVARPPGKKLQNISLLSGGEKTMTAIALIFAVFKVNPSPFCVLDEIDAALDEANVDRFATVLKEFAKIAQFIVITHNKKTIAHADVMYGVTMQQTGVSRVVSVKLSDREKAQGRPQAVPGEQKEAPAEDGPVDIQRDQASEQESGLDGGKAQEEVMAGV
jgi:chromosome segregation protein